MSKDILYFIDGFSYNVFTLDLERSSKKHKIKQAIEKLHRVYPGEVAEKHIYIAKRFKNCKTHLVLIAKDGIMLQGICTTLLVCSLLPTYTGRVLFATEQFYEYVNLEKGLLVKSIVQKRVSGITPEIEDVSLCIGLLKDIPIGCKKVIKLPVPNILVKKYPGCILGGKQKKVSFKALITTLVICTIVVASTLFVYRGYIQKKIETEQKNQIQAQKERKEAEKQKNIEYLEYLREKYISIQKKSKTSVYKILSSIYALLEKDARISAITVTGNMFQLDAYTSDAVTTLQTFENEKYMSEVEMRRIAIENDKEYFSLNGTVVNKINLPLAKNDIVIQIDEYEKLIYEAEQAAEEGYESLSEAAFAVRNLLRKNKCSEEVLQYIKTETDIEIECSLRSSAHKFFAFLADADRAEIPFEFSTVRIRAVENSNNVSATFRVKTGIGISDADVDFLIVEDSTDDEEKSVNPEDISKFFNAKKYVLRAFIAPPINPTPIKIEAKSNIQSGSHLEYIGSAKSGEIRYFLIKNTNTNKIHKLPLGAASGNTYKVISPTRLEVQIDGIQYEVEK